MDEEDIAEDRARFDLAIQREIERIYSQPITGWQPIDRKVFLEAKIRECTELLEVAVSPERKHKYRDQLAGAESELATIKAELEADRKAQPKSHEFYKTLLYQSIDKVGGWEEWLHRNGPEIKRTSVTEYAGSRIEKKVSKKKREAIEAAILRTAEQLGLFIRI